MHRRDERPVPAYRRRVPRYPQGNNRAHTPCVHTDGRSSYVYIREGQQQSRIHALSRIKRRPYAGRDIHGDRLRNFSRN